MHIALWNDFFKFFTNRLKAVDSAHLIAAWDKETARTKIYTQILSDVAVRMNLTLRQEHSRIDYMLGNAHPVNGTNPFAFVPTIAIESENKAMGAHREVNFLHAVTTPVKVLITCALWTRNGPKQRPPADLLKQWQDIRRVHVAAAPRRPDDVFAVIVGEKARDGGSVQFYLNMLSGPAADPSTEPFATFALPKFARQGTGAGRCRTNGPLAPHGLVGVQSR